jgi:hypothetical protein
LTRPSPKDGIPREQNAVDVRQWHFEITAETYTGQSYIQQMRRVVGPASGELIGLRLTNVIHFLSKQALMNSDCGLQYAIPVQPQLGLGLRIGHT